jgi:hypothetical protein
MLDAPFIRTEIVARTETGIIFSWSPNRLRFDFAVTNGESGLDTNSDKGFVGRVGIHGEGWDFGVSGKLHDGIASEQQKRFDNHVGVDFRAHVSESCTYYGEIVYDQHGFHRDFFSLADPASLGERSLYGRDVFKDDKDPAHGYGCYVGLLLSWRRLLGDVSYGVYTHEKIGDPFHDDDIHRLVVKGDFAISKQLNLFGVVIVENKRAIIPPFHDRPSVAGLTGMQFSF